MSDEDLIARSAEKNGESAQLYQLIEEFAELIVAVRHFKRGRITVDQLRDEMADALLMITGAEFFTGSINGNLNAKLLIIKGRLDA